MNSVQEIWHTPHTTATELLTAAASICSNCSTPETQAILALLAKRDISVHHKPVKVSSADTAYAVFHHSDHYEIFVIGEPLAVLQLCRLSENDREKSLLESRRLQNNSASVVSIAKGTVAAIPKNIRAVSGLTFCGHISLI